MIRVTGGVEGWQRVRSVRKKRILVLYVRAFVLASRPKKKLDSILGEELIENLNDIQRIGGSAFL